MFQRLSGRILIIYALIYSTNARVISVDANDQLYDAIRNVKAGDVIELDDGSWWDLKINLYGIGTKGNPIILRAKNPGSVIFSGQSQIKIGGKYIMISGFRFDNGYAVASGKSACVIEFRVAGKTCSYCTIENVLIKNYENKMAHDHWVRVFGYKNKVLNCQFEGKGYGHLNPGKMVWVHAENTPNYHLIKNNKFIDYNYIPNAENGREALQIGSSKTYKTATYTTVENNYFKNCNGDTEIVTIKASNTNFTGNVFENCHGNFSIRHSDRSIFVRNKFYGDYSQRSGGIQVRGFGHQIKHNWIQNIKDAGIVIHGSMKDRWLLWFPAKNITIEDNTLVNNLNGIAFGTWPYKDYRYYAPQKCSIFRNKISTNRYSGSIFRARNIYYSFVFQSNEVDNSSTLGIKLPSGVMVKKMDIRPSEVMVSREVGPIYLAKT